MSWAEFRRRRAGRHRAEIGDMLERAAEEFDKLAAPVYGDPPMLTTAERATVPRTTCPLCGAPVADHELVFDSLDRRYYLTCPGSTPERQLEI